MSRDIVPRCVGTSFAVGAAAAVALPFMMLHRANPLVPPKLFRSRNFTVTNISTLVIYGALYVSLTFQGIFLIGTLGYNEQAAGIAGIPGTLFLVLLSTRFGKLAARLGPRLFMALGPAVMAIGILWLGPNSSSTAVAPRRRPRRPRHRSARRPLGRRAPRLPQRPLSARPHHGRGDRGSILHVRALGSSHARRRPRPPSRPRHRPSRAVAPSGESSDCGSVHGVGRDHHRRAATAATLLERQQAHRRDPSPIARRPHAESERDP